MPEGEGERWAAENDPIDRYVARLTGELGFSQAELDAVDARVRTEVDEATEVAEQSPMPEALDALVGVYADPPVMEPLWFREGGRLGTDRNERAEGWGTWNTTTDKPGATPAREAQEND